MKFASGSRRPCANTLASDDACREIAAALQTGLIMAVTLKAVTRAADGFIAEIMAFAFTRPAASAMLLASFLKLSTVAASTPAYAILSAILNTSAGTADGPPVSILSYIFLSRLLLIASYAAVKRPPYSPASLRLT